MRAATAAGDHDEAERLHARYIELGTTYAGGWPNVALDDDLIRRIGARPRVRGCLRRRAVSPRLGRRGLDAACPPLHALGHPLRRYTWRTGCAAPERRRCEACRVLAAQLSFRTARWMGWSPLDPAWRRARAF